CAVPFKNDAVGDRFCAPAYQPVLKTVGVTTRIFNEGRVRCFRHGKDARSELMRSEQLSRNFGERRAFLSCIAPHKMHCKVLISKEKPIGSTQPFERA